MAKHKLFVFTHQVFKNLSAKPITENYPFEEAKYTDRMRGHIVIDIEQCISCTLCAQNCPPGAITVDRATGRWSIDRFDCVQCGNCVNICPKKCLHMEKGYTQPDTKKHTDVYTKKPKAKKIPQAGSECVFCGLCAKKCPQNAIEVDRTSKSWKLKEEACVGCGLCASSCPKKCIEMKEKEGPKA